MVLSPEYVNNAAALQRKAFDVAATLSIHHCVTWWVIGRLIGPLALKRRRWAPRLPGLELSCLTARVVANTTYTVNGSIIICLIFFKAKTASAAPARTVNRITSRVHTEVDLDTFPMFSA